MIAIGDSTLSANYSGLNISKAGHVAIGSKALKLHYGGGLIGSTAVGLDALSNSTVGFANTALGSNAGSGCISGDRNTFVGAYANTNNNGSSNSSAIGYSSQVTASNQVRIGSFSTNSIGGYEPWTNLSDKRFKINIKEDVIGTEFIMKLRPITYNLDMEAIALFNNTPTEYRNKEAELIKGLQLQTGFLAQDVEEAAAAVGYDFHGVDKPKNEKDFYGLRYAEFVVPLVKAVQEQQRMIEELRTEINKFNSISSNQ